MASCGLTLIAAPEVGDFSRSCICCCARVLSAMAVLELASPADELMCARDARKDCDGGG